MFYPIRKESNSRALIPAIDPLGSNKHLFLDEWNGYSLTKQVNHSFGIIQTAPIRPGVKFDLMGNSNANLLINCGELDISDIIDPVARLREIYLSVGGDLVVYDVSHDPLSKFQPSLIGDTLAIKLDFFSDKFVLEKDGLCHTGKLPLWHGWLNDGHDLVIYLGINGTINTSLGEARFNAEAKVTPRDTCSADPRAVEMLINSIKVVGITLDVNFTNNNRRFKEGNPE